MYEGVLEGTGTSMVVEHLGTGETVTVAAHAATGRWGTVVPTCAALDATLTRLLIARDDEATLRARLAVKGLIRTVPDRHHRLDSAESVRTVARHPEGAAVGRHPSPSSLPGALHDGARRR